MVIISLLDEHWEFFKSADGVEMKESPRNSLFTAYTLLSEEPLVVLDALRDERFQTSSSVVGPSCIRFFAGTPLVDYGGVKLGTFCLTSDEPRDEFSSSDQLLLIRLAALTTAALEQRLHTSRIAKAEKALTEANERYRLATRATSDGIWDWDRASGATFYSARLRSIVGLQDHDHCGGVEEWLSRVHAADLLTVRAEMQAFLSSNEPCFESDYRVRHEDGSWRCLHTRGVAIRDANREVLRLTGAASDVTFHRTRDEMTGLHSRISLLSALESHIQANGSDQDRFALMCVDLDRFKRVNDSFGHSCGDLLLMETANRIQLTLELDPADIVARIVGDEFAILLNNVQSSAEAIAYAERLIMVLHRPTLCGDQRSKSLQALE